MSACSICHSAVVGSDNATIVDRARHVDGNVDVSVPDNCSTCHGNTKNPAPPLDLSGSSDTASAGVGAHQTHVAGTGNSRRVPCGECHVVPNDVLSPGHLDSARPAELTFSGAALAFGAVPAYANGACGNTACHGAVFPNGHASGATSPSPVWTTVDGSQNACGACHSLPPPRPHPYQSDCSQCHKDIAPGNLVFLRPELHVDGIVTFELP
jgi:predicted CxxxxCH...CXXCH cytochrome family protein